VTTKERNGLGIILYTEERIHQGGRQKNLDGFWGESWRKSDFMHEKQRGGGGGRGVRTLAGDEAEGKTGEEGREVMGRKPQ